MRIKHGGLKCFFLPQAFLTKAVSREVSARAALLVPTLRPQLYSFTHKVEQEIAVDVNKRKKT